MNSADQDTQIVALLTEHQLAIRLYVQSLLPGDHSAHDVAQQANATLWRKREDFEVGTNFKAWAFSVARYEVLNHRKKKARESRRLTFSDEMEDFIAAELPQRVDDLEDRQIALRGCMQKLKQADRELIQHRYLHRTPLAEYAAQIGRTAGSLKVSLFRLRNRLQKCILHQLNMPSNKPGGQQA